MSEYNFALFDSFFAPPPPNAFLKANPKERLIKAIKMALADDGVDLTSNAVFSPQQQATAVLICKENSLRGGSLVAGLPLIPMIMVETLRAYAEQGLEETVLADLSKWSWQPVVPEGSLALQGQTVASIQGPVRLLLKAERVVLNFMTHLSGIANLTARYVEALEGMRAKLQSGIPYKRVTRLLDTRKTLPGLRFPEKYAVLIGGGENHRLSLEDMLMLKDNHIDAAGSISAAVERLRQNYIPCPPIEVECRNLGDVNEAISAWADRIMLDNMSPDAMRAALALIPVGIETEISGGISLDNMNLLEALYPEAPDFVSVGRLTHSAPAADFSLRIAM